MPKNENVVKRTPAVLANWSRLDKPDTKWKPEGEYSIELVFDESKEDHLEFLSALSDAHKEQHASVISSSPKKKKIPLGDTPVRPLEDEDGNEVEGFFKVKAKMRASGVRDDGSEWKSRVPVYDSARKLLTTPPAIGNGSTVKAIVEFAPYETPKGAGVSLRLQAVQIIDLVEYTANDKGGLFDNEEGWKGDDAPKGAKEGDFAEEDKEEKPEDSVPEAETEPAPEEDKTEVKKPAAKKKAASRF